MKQIAGKYPANVIVSLDRMERGTHSQPSVRQEIEQEFGVKIFSVINATDIICALEDGVIAGAEYLEALKKTH